MFAALNYVFPSGKSKFTPPFINHPLRYCVFFPIQASRYLSYLVYPLCISGAIFSMFYLRQQRWRLQIWDLQALMPLIMSVQMETDHCKQPNVFFPFTVITTGWSTALWLVSSRARTPCGDTDSVSQTSSLCLWHVSWLTSTLTSGLLSGVYALGFLSMAPQLFLNYKVGTASRLNISDSVNRQMNEHLTLLCGPPTCLDQLKSVSHLPRAVLVYRVSVNTFLHVVLKEGWIRAAPIICFCLCEFLFLLFTSSPTSHQGANTLITDVCSCASFFSPSLSISSPHHLSCFRDELLLFLYLYQRRWDTTHTLMTTDSLAHSLINSLTLACCCFISSPGVTPPRTHEGSLGHKARKSRLTESKRKNKISEQWTPRSSLWNTMFCSGGVKIKKSTLDFMSTLKCQIG